MKLTSHGADKKFVMFERNSQDEFLKLWDNIHDLQELSNITSRNLEDIYDKDILKLQHFQNFAQEEFKRVKSDIDEIFNGAVSSTRNSNDDGYDEKIFQLQDSIQMIRNSNKINQNLFQNFRSDMNRAYVDIDDLKKFRQQTNIELQMIKRLVDRVQVDLIEETIIKVANLETKMTNLEGSLNKASQRMRKHSKNNNEDSDNEKVELLLKEIQNMKTQMFFLQQSILQIRTQEHLSLEVSDGEVGPAYNSELSADVSRMKSDLQALREQYFGLERDFQSGTFVRRNDFDIRNNAIVERLDNIEEKVDNARIVADACDAASDSVKREMERLTTLLGQVE